jgi:hypothetical protein
VAATETPFQRWRNSPPEDEASLEAIKRTSLSMKYHDSFGPSDPDSGMVSEEVYGQDSVASSTASGSCSSKISGQSSFSPASYNSRRKRKGRRRFHNPGSRTTYGNKTIRNIECCHCHQRILSSLQGFPCPKCFKDPRLRSPFGKDLSAANVRLNLFCRRCGCPVDKMGVLQPKDAGEYAGTCHQCQEDLFKEIIGDLQGSEVALITPEHEDGKHGRRQAMSLPQNETRFDCTFCKSTFKTKYTWERHETSIHCPQEVWICLAKGPTIITDLGPVCVFCNLSNPTHDHLANAHNYAPCLQNKFSGRTFERKDGLQQHLKLVHSQNFITPYMLEHWMQHGVNGHQQWACGICPHDFSDWNTRLKHVGHHWDDGLSMKDWFHRDPLQGIQADNPAAPGIGGGGKHSIIQSSPQSPPTVPLVNSLLPPLKIARRATEISVSSTATTRPLPGPMPKPVSGPATPFSFTGLLKRFSRA